MAVEGKRSVFVLTWIWLSVRGQAVYGKKGGERKAYAHSGIKRAVRESRSVDFSVVDMGEGKGRKRGKDVRSL